MLELETEGALNVAEELPGAVTIFVTAPLAELERRLRERATESAGEIGERLDLAESQLRQATLFDHVVENDDLGRAVDELERIVSRTWPLPVPWLRDPATHRQAAREHRLAATPSSSSPPSGHGRSTTTTTSSAKGTFDELPPLVESRSKNYLTMALEEIAEGKITYEYVA